MAAKGEIDTREYAKLIKVVVGKCLAEFKTNDLMTKKDFNKAMDRCVDAISNNKGMDILDTVSTAVQDAKFQNGKIKPEDIKAGNKFKLRTEKYTIAWLGKDRMILVCDSDYIDHSKIGNQEEMADYLNSNGAVKL